MRGAGRAAHHHDQHANLEHQVLHVLDVLLAVRNRLVELGEVAGLRAGGLSRSGLRGGAARAEGGHVGRDRVHLRQDVVAVLQQVVRMRNIRGRQTQSMVRERTQRQQSGRLSTKNRICAGAEN